VERELCRKVCTPFVCSVFRTYMAPIGAPPTKIFPVFFFPQLEKTPPFLPVIFFPVQTPWPGAGTPKNKTPSWGLLGVPIWVGPGAKALVVTPSIQLLGRLDFAAPQNPLFLPKNSFFAKIFLGVKWWGGAVEHRVVKTLPPTKPPEIWNGRHKKRFCDFPGPPPPPPLTQILL